MSENLPRAQVKNWANFQHYRDRSPPWIKLHRGLLDDFDFTSLPVASKALAPMLWLLAAESKEGDVCVDPTWLAFRLRWTLDEVQQGLSPLIERGFLILASKPIAKRKQVARPERETEAEREGEKTLSDKSLGFDEFWEAYPVKKGKADALKSWQRQKLDAEAGRIIADVKARLAGDRQWLDGFIPHGSTYVNAKGWLDAIVPPKGRTTTSADAFEGAL